MTLTKTRDVSETSFERNCNRALCGWRAAGNWRRHVVTGGSTAFHSVLWSLRAVAMTTDEVESHQKKPKQQQEEAGQDSQLHCHEDDNLQPQNQNSTSRGLSRLFSSLLKRRSQYDSEGGHREDEEDEAKAPIADPEPELKIEGEVALDQHSVSSAEVQALQAEKKDAAEDVTGKVKEKNDQKGEAVVLDKEEVKEKEFGSERGGKEDKEKTTEEEVKTPRAPRRPKTLQIRVTLLDDALFECELDKHAKGQELFMKVCDHLNLLEKDYYGLAIWETSTMKTWMDLTKEIRRQVQGANYNFTFNVKFYPPDPAQLSEDITRYYLCLQLRKDILQGRLPCSFVTLALLGSYALQSELGEYDPEVHGNHYAKEMKMASGQTKELEDKMMELHRTYRIMCPAQADLMFLENAKKLSMYGVDLHQAKDLDGVDIMLGVCSSGLMVYKDKLRINRFPWPKVLKVSYKHSSFFIKIRPSETEQYESAIGFKLPNYKAAKKLWKVCVEHHTFFRLTSTEMATTPRKFLALGSKFRYSGRTQAQTRQASSLIDRPAPMFQRSSSKRNSRSLDGAMATTPDNKSNRPVSAPVMSPVSPGEAKPSPLLPTLPRHSHLDGSTPKSQRHTDWKRELKTECKPEHTKSQSPKPQSASEIKDLDKTQTEIMRHHTSISELKRSFMESVPEPRPSEWDKRLSTNSPLRSVSLNGQLQPASPVLRAQTVTISDVTNSLRGTVTYKDIPLVHTETKTITYESAQPVETLAEKDSGVLLSAQTITSETISTTTTTQITKTVKGGISETRIEKRIVITGDTAIDHDKALAQAIKEAKEQHPDMSVTKVVVHQETEITPD
ncbi:protein 4.1 isoform X9 [Gambusia affinis]|uniref:protein 4.1 isoform X9 n=1 Tax=Gambusia affinis TaxID=33528 RepID=UPI001CDD6261|nr:protein 4.1 isoform X9 [Gambusia affinis]